MRKVINILLVVGLFSCSPKRQSLTPAEYVRYMESDGHEMVREIVTGNKIYSIQLATPAYVACKDFDASESNKQVIGDRLAELHGTIFFIVSIQDKGGYTSPLNADEMAAYYSGPVIQDLGLHTQDGVIKPASCHFENNLGLSPKNTLIAAFEVGDTILNDIRFVLNDRYANNPMIQAGFSAESIANIPTLNIR